MKLRITIFLYLLAFAIGASPPASAQSLAKTFTLNAANQNACIGTSNLPTIGIDLSGSGSMTLQPQVSINGSTPKNSSVTSTVAGSSAAATIVTSGSTSASYVAGVGGFDTFCLNVSSYSSGSLTVKLNPSSALNASLLGGGGGGGTYSFFGNTTNPLTALTDPTTIIDAAGNFLAFAASGTVWQDSAGNSCTFVPGPPSNQFLCQTGGEAFLTLSDSDITVGTTGSGGGRVFINSGGNGTQFNDAIFGVNGATAGFGLGTTGPGVPVQGNITRLVGQTSGFSSTTAYTAPNAGAYRITASVYCDGSASAATATITLTYVDISNTTQSVTGTGAACTTLGASSFQQIEIPLAILKNQGTVKWAIAIASTPTYDAAIQVEQLTLE